MVRSLLSLKALLVFLALAGIILPGCASQKPGAIAVEEVTAVAAVTDIDAAKRVVTLKYDNGETRKFVVSDDVKNFDQIKVGDIVKASVLESVAIFVRKSNEQPQSKVTGSVNVAPKGDKPGIAITETFEVTAKIESLDANKGTITLKTPDGNIKTYAIQKTEDSFKNVKVGDEVVLDITMAVMVNVEKPAAAK